MATSSATVDVYQGQTITTHYCSLSTTSSYCRVIVGTVELHYWPTGKQALNKTYPTEVYLSKYDATLTSPSVYFAINTMRATDLCGQQVGPTLTDVITGYDLTDVYTLQPYKNAAATTRMGPPEQLQLSDLRTDCPAVTADPNSLDSLNLISYKNILGTNDTECNPILSWPTRLKHIADPYWSVCGRHNGGAMGIFDPPVPVTTCSGSAEECLYGGGAGASSAAATTTTQKTSSATAPAGDLTTSTSATPAQTVSSLPSSTSTTLSTEAATSTGGSSNPLDPSGPETVGTSSAQSSAVGPTATTQSAEGISDPTTTAIIVFETTTSTSTTFNVVAITGSDATSVIAGSSEVTLPKESTSSTSSVVTFTDEYSGGGGNAITTSSENLLVGSSPSTLLTRSSSPTATLMAIATIGSTTLFLAPSASSLVIDTQTAYLSGPAITISSQVIKLTPSGVVVGDISSGSFSTYVLPPSLPTTTSSAILDIATVNGNALTISTATQSSEAVIINGQTLNLGGSVATLSNGNIASLGSAGIVIQAPSGIVTTLPLPTTTSVPAPAQTGSGKIVLGSQTIAVNVISTNVVVIQNQTISVHGQDATLSNGEVVSLASGGAVVVVQTTITATTSSLAINSDSNAGEVSAEADNAPTGTPTTGESKAAGYETGIRTGIGATSPTSSSSPGTAIISVFHKDAAPRFSFSWLLLLLLGALAARVFF